MFLSHRFVICFCIIFSIFGLGYFWSTFIFTGACVLAAFLVVFLADLLSLYWGSPYVDCRRQCASQFSNGDVNEVELVLRSAYRRKVRVSVIDELPSFFQIRNFRLSASLLPDEPVTLTYRLRPTHRGLFVFHNLHVYVNSRLGLTERRFSFDAEFQVKVLPSFSIIRNMQFLSVENREHTFGIKQVRRIGQSREFEEIKEYVRGDDYRTINWTATARRHQIMCNVYCEEQSQQIYSVIDKGRGMQHAFKGMTLLDYSINSALAMAYISIHHSDNAGLITFEKNIDVHVQAERSPLQMLRFMNVLCQESSSFIQSDYSCLYSYCKLHLHKRSLLIIYTTFDSKVSMERQLPYLRKLSLTHVVLVVFFKDWEIESMVHTKPYSDHEYFEHVIAEKFQFEKKMIVRQLNAYGIYALLTPPEKLTINVINKYLEMKARHIV